MPEQFTHRAICQLRMRGQVIRDHFVSQVLSRNPLGDPAERDLLVYLPPGYERSASLRYPVVFALRLGVLLKHQRWSAVGVKQARVHLQAIVLARTLLQQWPSCEDTRLVFRRERRCIGRMQFKRVPLDSDIAVFFKLLRTGADQIAKRSLKVRPGIDADRHSCVPHSWWIQ